MSTESTLSQLYTTFAQRGWDVRVLQSLRMQMSSGDLGGQGGNAAGTGEGGEGAGQGAGDPSVQGGDSGYSLGPGFLDRVPQEHRAILEPYVKQWDAGVTRRFQELQSRLSPWEQLNADPESVQMALGIMQELEANPWSVYGRLQQALTEMGGLPGQQPPVGPQGQQPPVPGQQPPVPGQEDQGVPGVPPEFQQRFDRVEQAVLSLAQHLAGQQQQSQTQQQEEQLNGWLETLHDEFGDFDDDWVLTKVWKSGDIGTAEQHIQAWQNMLKAPQQQQGQLNSMVPALLGAGGGGGSAPPLDATGIKNLDQKSVRDLVARTMQAAAQNSG